MPEVVDGKYYEVARGGSLASQLLIKARDRIYQDFLHTAGVRDDDEILDVGVSDVLEEGANVLERRYPFPGRITACGLGEGTEFRNAFPDVTFTRIEPNRSLPFADGQFGVATCNAVLEHVGSIENQRLLVVEMCRVARRVFVTVPNRFFPFEHHTAIPLAHYADWLFRPVATALGKSSWTLPQNLILMSKGRLANAFDSRVEIGWTGILLGPFSSNLYAYWQAA